jgi:hypothetical protein
MHESINRWEGEGGALAAQDAAAPQAPLRRGVEFKRRSAECVPAGRPRSRHRGRRPAAVDR